MYKDKAKQREANRRAKMRQRKGMTKGMTSEGVTLTPVQNEVIPDLELCRACGVKLPSLENPRLYFGKCYNCSTESVAV